MCWYIYVKVHQLTLISTLPKEPTSLYTHICACSVYMQSLHKSTPRWHIHKPSHLCGQVLSIQKITFQRPDPILKTTPWWPSYIWNHTWHIKHHTTVAQSLLNTKTRLVPVKTHISVAQSLYKTTAWWPTWHKSHHGGPIPSTSIPST